MPPEAWRDAAAPIPVLGPALGFVRDSGLYRGDVARELYEVCVTDGFMFDIEIILRAIKKGKRIEEFPVEWACDPDSRLSVTRTPWPVLAELCALRRAMKTNRHAPPKPHGQISSQ